MYTIISGTDRKGSNTKKVAEQYCDLFNAKGINTQLIALDELDLLGDENNLKEVEENVLIPSKKIIFIIPEYNGSFPGILKLFIDHSQIQPSWWYKKAMLAGISSGRAGNLRGMDHLTGILHYLKIQVLPNKLPISSIENFINEEGMITDPAVLEAIDNQIEEFIKF